jgi:maltooligosyltrehalose synthase
MGSGVWSESGLALNHAYAAGPYRDVFTGRLICAGVESPLAQAFAHLPVALLERVKE